MTGFTNQTTDTAPSLEGYFHAVVVANNDPDMRQRIKVRIPNELEGSEEFLPWIGPFVQSKFGMSETFYSVEVPAVGSHVVVSFQDGQLSYGVSKGSLHTTSSNIGGSDLAVNYPNRRGWVDPAGNVCWIDVTNGSVVFHFRHKSGTEVRVEDDGHINVTGEKGINVKAKEDIVIESDQNITIQASGALNLIGNPVNIN